MLPIWNSNRFFRDHAKWICSPSRSCTRSRRFPFVSMMNSVHRLPIPTGRSAAAIIFPSGSNRIQPIVLWDSCSRCKGGNSIRSLLLTLRAIAISPEETNPRIPLLATCLVALRQIRRRETGPLERDPGCNRKAVGSAPFHSLAKWKLPVMSRSLAIEPLAGRGEPRTALPEDSPRLRCRQPS